VQWEGWQAPELGEPVYKYGNMTELRNIVRAEGLNIYEIMLANEMAMTGATRPQIIDGLNEILDRIDHPLFGVCWDTGHANCGGSQYEDIMAIGEELYAIHYNDNHGEKDEHLAPFLGNMNHDEVIRALIDANFKGYFTLECSSSLVRYDQWTGARR
jgi:sugar phosphate isomerase/epimerase